MAKNRPPDHTHVSFGEMTERPSQSMVESTASLGDETTRMRKEDEINSSDAQPDLEKASNHTPVLAQQNEFFVEFNGLDDRDNPKNWTSKRRWAITVSMGLMVFTVTFASSIFSVNIGVVQEKFNVELVTATLGVALFVLVSYTQELTSNAVANIEPPRVSYSDQLPSGPCQKF